MGSRAGEGKGGTWSAERLTADDLDGAYLEMLSGGSRVYLRGKGTRATDRPMSPRSVEVLHAVAKAAFRLAIDRGELVRNPAALATPPAPGRATAHLVDTGRSGAISHLRDRAQRPTGRPRRRARGYRRAPRRGPRRTLVRRRPRCRDRDYHTADRREPRWPTQLPADEAPEVESDGRPAPRHGRGAAPSPRRAG